MSNPSLDSAALRRAAVGQRLAKIIALLLLIAGSVVFMMPFWISVTMYPKDSR